MISASEVSPLVHYSTSIRGLQRAVLILSGSGTAPASSYAGDKGDSCIPELVDGWWLQATKPARNGCSDVGVFLFATIYNMGLKFLPFLFLTFLALTYECSCVTMHNAASGPISGGLFFRTLRSGHATKLRRAAA